MQLNIKKAEHNLTSREGERIVTKDQYKELRKTSF
jgi:hypothetical protein